MHEINPIWFAPFILLLLCIALMPFINAHWWERHFPKVAVGLGLLTLVYYAFWVKNYDRIGHTAIEYVGFIALVGSLFVVAGGIVIRAEGEARPVENILLLAAGALLANIIGTAGASMLLIRPFIRMNQHRISAFHIVFFIFIVSNVGGCLTPIGDPPLFLGYLKGIPFFWVAEHLWFFWLIGVGWLLAVFLAFDIWSSGRAREKGGRRTTGTRCWQIQGMRNFVFILIILCAVFVSEPIFLREVIMIGAGVGGYLLTRSALPQVHKENQFNFAPLREVAWLFAGIFATMMPVLDWLEHHSSELGITSVGAYYWGSGTLSSVLDNAPTYLNFLSAALGSFVPPSASDPIGVLLESHARHVMAISVGAVFFGAMTYIGNAPNFMVRSIAQHQKVPVPSFFGYVFKYSLPIMLPMLVLVWYLFFR